MVYEDLIVVYEDLIVVYEDLIPKCEDVLPQYNDLLSSCEDVIASGEDFSYNLMEKNGSTELLALEFQALAHNNCYCIIEVVQKFEKL